MAVSLKNNKTAQVFSLISILMSVLFILIYSQVTHVPLDKDSPVIKTEIGRLDTFVKDFDELVNNAIDRTAYQTLEQFSLLQQTIYATNASVYFENVSAAFIGCFESEEFVYNSSYSSIPCFTGNTSSTLAGENFTFSFNAYMQSLILAAEDLYGADIALGPVIADVEFGTNAFELVVHVQTTIAIEKESYSWNRFIDVYRTVEIQGISHPLFEGRRIRHQPYDIGNTFNLSRFEGDPDKVVEFITSSYYFVDKRAPSLFDIYEGNFSDITNNSFGISSILDDSFSPDASATGFIEFDYLSGTSPSGELYYFPTGDISNDIHIPLNRLEEMGFSSSSSIINLV